FGERKTRNRTRARADQAVRRAPWRPDQNGQRGGEGQHLHAHPAPYPKGSSGPRGWRGGGAPRLPLRGRCLVAERQTASAFDLHRFQSAGVETQQLEDGRGDLGGLDRRVVHEGLDSFAGHNQRNVAVLWVRAAVLSVLAFPASVDGAVLADREEVWHASVSHRDMEVGG